MPSDGVEFIPHHEILSYEEIIRICNCFAKLGIRKVKLTGGEPLVRKDFPYLVKQIKGIEGIDNVTLTTNGILLEEQLDALVAAGIDGINVSLDTLDSSEYAKLTRYDKLDQVMRGIHKVLEQPKINLKINCLPIIQKNQEDSILSLLTLAQNNKLSLRFIELMPIGLGKDLKGSTEDNIRQIVEKKYGTLTLYDKSLGNGPCTYYSLDNFQSKIGFISAISHKFCNKCNRIRLTSDGYLKNCLHFSGGVDLKEIIRRGISDDELTDVIYQTILKKPKEHQFVDNKDITFAKSTNSELNQEMNQEINQETYQEIIHKNLESINNIKSEMSQLEERRMSQIGG
jgi:cyclic pyranopterin phosphate synthase